jgi:hypothetical protein
MGEVSKVKFVLPNEKIEVKFIKRKKGMAANVEDNHIISGGMLENSVKRFCAPALRSGVVKNLFSPEEKEFLEEETGLKLSAYSEFWHTQYVSLFKQSSKNIFDTSLPFDFIAMKILLANSNEIAPNWQSRNEKQTYQFAITREDEVKSEDKKKLDVVKDAWKAYSKIEDNKEMLLGVISILQDRQISVDSKLEWIQGEVEKKVDSDPAKFLSLLKDASFETQVLIRKAINKKVIITKSKQLYTEDGIKLASKGEVASFNKAVRFLEDPKNQEIKDFIIVKTD